jgi:hypothetical protein
VFLKSNLKNANVIQNIAATLNNLKLNYKNGIYSIKKIGNEKRFYPQLCRFYQIENLTK